MDIFSNCSRHKKIGTKAAAQAVAAKLRGRSQKYRGLRAYSCDVGGELHWHVGRAKRR